VTRRFVVIGQKATASPDFNLLDIAGTSGRLDILLRCLRSALLVSHGLRRDTIVYLVLLGGDDAPRVLRVDGRHIRFVRPDERQLAILVQKALTRVPVDSARDTFIEVRPGLAVASGGIDAVLADLEAAPTKAAAYVLEENARDVRDLPRPLEAKDVVVFVGDQNGFDELTRERLDALGATAIGVGPVSLHADDAITIVCNELDRRQAAESTAS
jgi:tRNA (pseudouridine54-N1)-methyltransferase